VCVKNVSFIFVHDFFVFFAIGVVLVFGANEERHVKHPHKKRIKQDKKMVLHDLHATEATKNIFKNTFF